MMTKHTLVSAALFVGLTCSPALGNVVTYPATVNPTALKAGAGGSTYVVNIPGATDMGGEEIVFALFSLTDALSAGTEVEVWPQIAGDVPPWEAGGGLEGYRRNFWVMDERTGSYLQFDVTRIAQAWAEGSLPNLGLLVRVLENSDSQKALGAGVSAKDLQIALYTDRNDAPSRSSLPGEEHRRKLPRIEDGRKN